MFGTKFNSPLFCEQFKLLLCILLEIVINPQKKTISVLWADTVTKDYTEINRTEVVDDCEKTVL
jgi:hypothetical protein